MIKDLCSQPVEPVESSGIRLISIWNVHADRSYDVHRNRKDGLRLIAARTHSGCGAIELENKRLLVAEPQTLVIMEETRLRRYGCAKNSWKFWWFEFVVTGQLHFPLHAVMKISSYPGEKNDFKKTFSALRHQSFSLRACASAVFASMLYRWMSGWEIERQTNPRRLVIEKTINLMHDNLFNPLPVSDIAKHAGISERLFRNIFSEVTGKSPKRYYNELRLKMGAELLMLGMYNVAQVSDRLGFSSPFHFSREYKKLFGHAPSSISAH